MVRMVVAGDTHGNVGAIRYKAEIAKEHGADRILVVGDFGLWPGHDGVRYLDEVNRIAHDFNIHVFALPGNHEDHDQWDKWMNFGLPTASGFTYVRDRLLLSPKVHNWKWGGRRFFICGGAVSIDKKWRTEGVSWWAGEQFDENNLASVLKYRGASIDYLFTHDCSDYTPWKNRLKPDLDSQRNRNRIDQAINHLKPRMHFHGHMHERYDWVNTKSHGKFETPWGVSEDDWNGAETQTYGLQCDYEDDSWLILDTGELKGKAPRPDAVYWPERAHLLVKE